MYVRVVLPYLLARKLMVLTTDVMEAWVGKREAKTVVLLILLGLALKLYQHT